VGYDGDRLIDLLAAVLKMAKRDARRGSDEANEFLKHILGVEKMSKLSEVRQAAAEAIDSQKQATAAETARIKANVAAVQQRYEAQQKAVADAETARIEQAAQQRQAASDEALRQEALSAWRSSGGSDADFETTWPQLRIDLLRQRTLSRMETTRAKVRGETRSRF
jgi:hypothetical protein